MGTRSTYRVIEEYVEDNIKKTNKLILVYVQFDGYPEGHPIETAEWLSKGKVVNGFGEIKEDEVVFNGAGCLAAQLVHKLKRGTGGTYILDIKTRGKNWEQYTYDIIVKTDGSIEYVCYEVGGMKNLKFNVLFRGTPEEFVKAYTKVETEK